MLEAPEYKLNSVYDKISTCRGMAVDEGAPNKTSRQSGINSYATNSYSERTVFPFHRLKSSAGGDRYCKGSDYFLISYPFNEKKEFKQFKKCIGGIFDNI